VIPPPTKDPVERFGRLILCLSWAIDSHRLGNQGGWLPVPLMQLILTKLHFIIKRFRRLTDRIKAGKIYRRTKPSAPRRNGGKRAPAKYNPLPTHRRWLFRLAREDAAGAAGELRAMLADPEMAKLLAAAPGPMWRTIRPLCWMLGVERPAALPAPPDPKTGLPRPCQPPRPLPALPPWTWRPDPPQPPSPSQSSPTHPPQKPA
jgi:hypothetical protein